MKPWVRGPNNRISSNSLYEYRVIPDPYASDDEFFESSTYVPFFFPSNSTNDTIPWDTDYHIIDNNAEKQASPDMAVTLGANNGVNQAVPNYNRTLRDLLLPGRNATLSCINFSNDANNFHFRNDMS